MPIKILAIDDSKTMRLAVKITFAAEDAEVTSVSRGSEAIARVKQLNADVVLVDARLAEGEPSGYDVCRALKSDETTSHIPVVVMASSQTGVDQEQLRASGADGFMTKPFDTQELIDAVNQLVGVPVTARPETSSPRRPVAASAGRVSSNRRPAVASSGGGAAPPMRAVTPPMSPIPRMAAQKSASPTSMLAGRRPVVDGGGADIPVATPIPFTSADAPTAGILRRLSEAGSVASGIDPRVAEALVALSHDVIEKVVWEVVPDLAEEILKRHAQARSA